MAHEKRIPAWALRFMGQTEQGMQPMLRRIPDHISLESVRATWAARLYLYRTDFPVQPDAKVACWYGEKEGHYTLHFANHAKKAADSHSYCQQPFCG